MSMPMEESAIIATITAMTMRMNLRISGNSVWARASGPALRVSAVSMSCHTK